MTLRSCTLLALSLAGVALLPCAAQAQRLVDVYVTHVETDGTRWDSLEEMRSYLLTSPRVYFGVYIRECAAKKREVEVMTIVLDVLRKRLGGIPINQLSRSVPCGTSGVAE